MTCGIEEREYNGVRQLCRELKEEWVPESDRGKWVPESEWRHRFIEFCDQRDMKVKQAKPHSPLLLKRTEINNGMGTEVVRHMKGQRGQPVIKTEHDNQYVPLNRV